MRGSKVESGMIVNPDVLLVDYCVICKEKESPESLFNEYRFDTEKWTGCEVCGRWFHNVCLEDQTGEMLPDEDQEEEDDYICLHCRNAPGTSSTSL